MLESPAGKKKVKRGSQKSANIDPKLSKVERKRRMDQLRKSLTKGTEGGESQSLLASKDTDEEQGGESQSLLAAKDTDASQSQYPQTPNVLWKRKRRRQP